MAEKGKQGQASAQAGATNRSIGPGTTDVTMVEDDTRLLGHAPAAPGFLLRTRFLKSMTMPTEHDFPDHALPDSGEHWVDRLGNGSRVLIRPLRPEDRIREMSFIRDLSADSRRMRFLGDLREPSPALIDSLMDVDGVRRIAFVALAHDDGVLREIGVSRFSADDTGEGGEVAIAIANAWRGIGLEHALMGHLIERVRAQAFRHVYAVEFAENQTVRQMARDLKFTCSSDEGDPSLVIYRLSLLQ